MSVAVTGLYAGILGVALRFKYLTLASIIGLLIFAMPLAGYLPKMFFPPSDRAQFYFDLYMPEGTDIRETRRIVLKAENYILTHYKDAVRNTAVYIGEKSPLEMLMT